MDNVYRLPPPKKRVQYYCTHGWDKIAKGRCPFHGYTMHALDSGALICPLLECEFSCFFNSSSVTYEVMDEWAAIIDRIPPEATILQFRGQDEI